MGSRRDFLSSAAAAAIALPHGLDAWPVQPPVVPYEPWLELDAGALADNVRTNSPQRQP